MAEDSESAFLRRLERIAPRGSWVAPYRVGRGSTNENLRVVYALRRQGAIEVDRHFKIRLPALSPEEGR